MSTTGTRIGQQRGWPTEAAHPRQGDLTPEQRQAARLAAEAMGRPLHLTAQEAARWEAQEARQWAREGEPDATPTTA